jgi:uncharacterized glyoxalase superfamily protein PhnB
MFDAMTTPRGDRPVLLAAEPQMFVKDLQAACDFYVSALGFEVAFMYGELPFYAQVARDGARLNLRHAEVPAISAEFRAQEGDILSATITTDDAAALFREYQARGVAFHQELRQEPWGAHTFMVADPDGNLMMFAG